MRAIILAVDTASTECQYFSPHLPRAMPWLANIRRQGLESVGWTCRWLSAPSSCFRPGHRSKLQSASRRSIFQPPHHRQLPVVDLGILPAGLRRLDLDNDSFRACRTIMAGALDEGLKDWRILRSIEKAGPNYTRA